MTIIPVPERINFKQVNGTFYPLQRAELVALRQSRLINNAAYVHLALRFSNPFCDRPIELIPKEFALEWNLPESSVYEALGKLKQKKIVDIKTGKVVISWTNNLDTEILEYEEETESSEDLLDPRVNSEIPENCLETQNELPDRRKSSETSEKQDSKALPGKDSDSSQTIETPSNHQTNQTSKEGGEKNKELNTESPNVNDEKCDLEEVSESSSSMTPLSDVLASTQESKIDKPSPKVINCSLD